MTILLVGSDLGARSRSWHGSVLYRARRQDDVGEGTASSRRSGRRRGRREREASPKQRMRAERRHSCRRPQVAGAAAVKKSSAERGPDPIPRRREAAACRGTPPRRRFQHGSRKP
ncbi:hypothetical protein GQ55_3G035200 [Panicum hallii var. hallii]|uniref:Uncharacterized protein n=1 Tax=Panicum hallii var. hallii TaxID=1504633 RepID=A0A2T7E5B6_9POAL|nr:hypothetical protein GQ55_3G035200 [Panicum hallii var. hallii]